jgi:hypothetical protein
MVNPNRFYTYAYLRVDRTPYYIGKGNGDRVYYKSKYEVKPPKDKSRILFLKQNITEEEAFRHEKYMIAVFGRKDLGTGILRNRTDGGEGSSGWVPDEEFRKNVSKMHKGEKNHNYGKTGEKNHNYGKKWWNDGYGNLKLSIKCPGEGWVLGRGEEFRKKCVVYMCELSKEEKEKKIENGKRSGNIVLELKLGIHSLTKEQRSNNSKITNSQKWMCTETGFVSTSGPLSRYQRKRGIDTSKRKRVS